MYKKIFLLFISLSIFTTYCTLLTTVFAQQATGLNLTVSPSVLDLSANPGDTIVQKFRVRNNTFSPLSLHLSVDTLHANQNGDIIPIKGSRNDPSLSWVSFDQNPVDAPSNEWATVTITISVPKTAAFGYYYAIHLSQQNESSQSKSGAKLLGEVVIPVLLNIKSPNAKAQLQLLSFSPSSTIFEYLPVSFSVNLQNTGNVHIHPRGNIFVRVGTSDSEVNVIDINQAGGAILPGSKRTFVSSWTDGFIVEQPVIEDGVTKVDSNGKPLTHLTINWDKLTHFRLGKYTATALVVYDNGTRDVPLSATTTFWVIPWKVILGLLVTLIIVIFLVRFWLNWYVGQQIKKYHKE